MGRPGPHLLITSYRTLFLDATWFLSRAWSLVIQAEAQNVISAGSTDQLRTLVKLADRGARDQRVLVLSDSRVVVGACCKGRSSSRRLNFVLRRIAGVCGRAGLTLDVVWVPTWANPADAPSRGKVIKKLSSLKINRRRLA